jgi:hypothetical protein
MTDQPDDDINPDDIDFTQLPHIVNAVLDAMPNGDMWRARFTQQPGGMTVQPADADGWLTVSHAGDVMMKLHISTFKRGAPLGDAQVMVDGTWQTVGLERRDDDDDDEQTDA